MKSFPAFLLFALALAALAPGCTSPGKQANDTAFLLSSAGFKAMPATTAEHEQQLAALRPDTITTVQHNGKTFYVYPQPEKKVFFIGTQPEYTMYQRLVWSQHVSQADFNAARSTVASEMVMGTSQAITAYGVDWQSMWSGDPD